MKTTITLDNEPGNEQEKYRKLHILYPEFSPLLFNITCDYLPAFLGSQYSAMQRDTEMPLISMLTL